MIRLITCDLDGTLLPKGQWTPSQEIFELIRELQSRGIAFAAASGRQYHSLRTLFAPVADDIWYIAENGSVVAKGDRMLSQTVLDQSHAKELTAQILAVPDAEVMISGAHACYLIPKSEGFVHHIRDVLQFETVLVSSFDEIPEPVIKVSACRLAGAAALYSQFAPQWETVFQMAVAGHEWLDFTSADKGTGLDELCRHGGYTYENVMSFGDNYNDLPLLLKAGTPYIMENACEELRDRFSLHCTRVEQTITELLHDLDEKIEKTT